MPLIFVRNDTHSMLTPQLKDRREVDASQTNPVAHDLYVA
jgi:hypothetical protein